MAPKYRFSKKAKRIRSLVLSALTATSTLIALFLHEIMQSGQTPNMDSTALFVVSQSTVILMMGIGVVFMTLKDELIKKRKSKWEKELFGNALIWYVLVAMAVLLYLNTDSSLSQGKSVYMAANVVTNVYLASIWLSVACICAGKS